MPAKKLAKDNPYFIDNAKRVKAVQKEMARAGIDVYLGSRLRTMSWILDAFCPWRTFVVIPPSGLPTAVTFVIDAARVQDESWLDQDHVLGYGPMGGQDQVALLSMLIKPYLKGGKGVIGIETGMGNYLPEGHLTLFEYLMLKAAMPKASIKNAHDIIDRLSLIKDEGTINRFREASRIVDVGHKAVYDAIKDGGYAKMTETEVGGLAAGACTPASRRKLKAGDPLMVDLHAMYRLGLGDHSHNYFLGKATKRQQWHAKNFVDLMKQVLITYRAGITPTRLADEMLAFAEEKGFQDYMVPGFEHGIGLMGDEWRIGLNDGPFQYWTNPEHVYQKNEMLICAVQYACPEENIGFRYENPILIKEKNCEAMSRFPLSVNVV